MRPLKINSLEKVTKEFLIGFQVAFSKEVLNYPSNLYNVDWQLFLSELIFPVLSKISGMLPGIDFIKGKSV